jgi:hypothetical protein
VFIKTFFQWFYIIFIYVVHKCSTPLSIFSTIAFCTTCFFHDSTLHDLSIP